MASLKEVKTRIASVNSTRKITSAMKMVASSKLHHAQQAIESMRPYEHQLSHIMSTFVANMEGSIESPYAGSREIKRVAIVVYTSNSSLCGAFNANVVKAFNHKLDDYKKAGIEVVKVYALGKKAADAVAKVGFNNPTDYSTLLDHPSYKKASDIATEIMDLYTTGQIDKAELIYHHFKSAGSQILTEETFLPIELDTTSNNNQEGSKQAIDFIAEPSKEDVIAELIPKSLHLKLFTALLDSLASEHAARVIAMQAATDNADDLLRELTLTYNKTRQQAITSELLDIVGGSMQ
ncbi:MAG: F0F1 ATP synthase subunit gamma [Prevotellamassilia sp.]|nr:F0F1 ATP synthase subunit gamma [Prevotellamassilia sp.]